MGGKERKRKHLTFPALKKKKIFFEVGFQDRCSMGGKAWKEEEEEEGYWQEGVAGAGPREHLSGNRPGRGRLALAQGSPQPSPALPRRGTCGCPALPQARLEVFQLMPGSKGI